MSTRNILTESARHKKVNYESLSARTMKCNGWSEMEFSKETILLNATNLKRRENELV